MVDVVPDSDPATESPVDHGQHPDAELFEFAMRPALHAGIGFKVHLTVLILLALAGIAAYGYQLVGGIGTTGLNDQVFWGVYTAALRDLHRFQLWRCPRLRHLALHRRALARGRLAHRRGDGTRDAPHGRALPDYPCRPPGTLVGGRCSPPVRRPHRLGHGGGLDVPARNARPLRAAARRRHRHAARSLRNHRMAPPTLWVAVLR